MREVARAGPPEQAFAAIPKYTQPEHIFILQLPHASAGPHEQAFAAILKYTQPKQIFILLLIVEAAELQKFKLGTNDFLLGVDGLQSTLCPSVLNIFCIL